MKTLNKGLIAAAGLSVAAALWAHPGHPPIAPPRVSFAPTAASIPFELFRGQRIFLAGTVNGHATPIMLESGAGMTVIDQAFARKLGLKGGTTIQIRGATGTSAAQIATGVSLTAGSLHLDDLSVLIVDLSSMERHVGRAMPVLLGSEAFKAGAVTVDFPHNRLTFTDRAKFTPPAGATRIALGERERVPTIEVSVAGLPPVTADLDLGNGGTLLLSNAMWKNEPKLSSLRHAQWQAGGIGGMKVSRQAIVPSIEFAGRRFTDVPAVLNDDPQSLPATGANVGIGLFRSLVVTLDFSGNALYLNGPTAINDVARERAGAQFELAGDRLKALFISPDSPAAAAGLKAGDEFVAVDGRPVDQHYYDRPDWVRGAAGRMVTLTRADGSVVPVVLSDYY